MSLKLKAIVRTEKVFVKENNNNNNSNSRVPVDDDVAVVRLLLVAAFDLTVEALKVRICDAFNSTFPHLPPVLRVVLGCWLAVCSSHSVLCVWHSCRNAAFLMFLTD